MGDGKNFMVGQKCSSEDQMLLWKDIALGIGFDCVNLGH